MLKKLDSFLSPIANSLSKNKVLSAIRDGFLITTPIVIIGSIFLLIANFPINGYTEFMAGIFGEGWDSYLGRVTAIAFDCIALLSSFAIGYCYAREKGLANRVSAATVALVSFLIVTPQSHPNFVNVDDSESVFRGFAFGNFGTAGIFLSMIVAIVAVSIFAWAINKKLIIKLPDGVPPAVMDSFAALIPAALAMVFFFIVNIIISHTSYEYLHNLIYEVLQAPLVGLGKFALFEVIYQFLSTLFWFFGINGPAVTNTVFAPIHKALTLENYEAAQAGLQMTNIFTAGFSDFFCNFGGGGSTLGLVIMMSFLAKSERLKVLGRLSLPAGIFGINEPIIFGFPIVFNLPMMIPFVLVPAMGILISYAATAIGFMNKASVLVPWTTPPLLNAYLATGADFRAVLVQLVVIALGVLIYLPFLRISAKTLEKQAELEQ